MTYITDDARALREDYEVALIRSGRPPAMFYTRDGKRMVHRSLLPPNVGRSPLSLQYRDRGPGNAGQSTVYLDGLGDLGDAVQDVLDKMSDDVKKELIKSAAVNAAIAISLNALPIVGWALSLVYAGVQAIVGSKYQRESEALIGDFQNEMKATQAQFQAKIDAAANEAMRQEAPAAQQLALSNLPLEGLGEFGDIWSDAKDVIMRPVKEAQRIVKQVVGSPVYNTVQKVVGKPLEQVANKVEDAAFDARDTLTGRSAKEDVEKAIDKARGIAVGQMSEAANKAIAEINSPAYRQQLRINMAKQIRADPAVAAMLNQIKPGTPTISTPGTNVSEPAKGISLLPMGAAAAAVVAFGFLKS